jgi:hypothetical protein
MQKFTRFTRLSTLFLVLLTIMAGCEDKRRHQASEEVAFPVVSPPVGKEATPEDTALALLDAMKTLQNIRAVGFGVTGNNEKYDQAMGLIASLMDKEGIYANVKGDRSPTVPRDISRDAAVRLVAEAWVSTAAHYLNGIDATTKSATIQKKGAAAGKARRDITLVRDTDEATVHVDAENPSERKALAEIEDSKELTSASGADGKPLAKDSEAYIQKVRTLAIERGFNVPIRAQFSIILKQMPEGWRAIQFRLQSPGSTVVESN